MESSCSEISVSSIISTPLPNTRPIRYIKNDQNNHREKYNGWHWKLVCTWNQSICQNFAVKNKLCQRNNQLIQTQIQKSKLLALSFTSLITSTQIKKKAESVIMPTQDQRTFADINDQNKSHNSHFKQFLIVSDDDDDDDDNNNDTMLSDEILPEIQMPIPDRVTRSSQTDSLSFEGCISELNIKELISKNIPPLTDFEEIYIATLLMEKFPPSCSIQDAQIYLHQKVIEIINRNYGIQMQTIAPHYIYDFLIRHPLIAIRYKRWFSSCESALSLSGSSIDTKKWVLSAMIKGALISDSIGRP
ncbi:hypothetical protein I4U23_024755 [Adineta vaga]|nr:hypothetical protein I4U23_024755 [Adineta vaga]